MRKEKMKVKVDSFAAGLHSGLGFSSQHPLIFFPPLLLTIHQPTSQPVAVRTHYENTSVHGIQNIPQMRISKEGVLYIL